MNFLTEFVINGGHKLPRQASESNFKMPDLPLKELRDLEELEKLLKEKPYKTFFINDKKKKKTQRLRFMAGGTNPERGTKLICKGLFGKSLCLKFSLKGKGKLKKMSFQNLGLYKIITST